MREEGQSPGPTAGRAPVRPPAFLLPGAAYQSAIRSDAKIYLSWGGEIYGPATREEVLAGIRTSWFEEGALYWREGVDEWKPLSDFPVAATDEARERWRPVRGADLPSAPSLPSASGQRHRGSRPKGPKTPRPEPLQIHGRGIVFAFAILAALMMAGIILLLMLV